MISVAILALLTVGAGVGIGVGVGTAEAACNRGSPSCPIEVRIPRGSYTTTVRGVLTPERDCCAFALRARAGQVMTWNVAGPPVELGIRYPSGQVTGPGLPQAIRLPQNGVYLFGVLPHHMAEDA